MKIKPKTGGPAFPTHGGHHPDDDPRNLHKGGYGLEEWRALLARAPAILSRDKSLFRAAQRFGVIAVTDAPVTFYFERCNHE